MHGPSSYLLPLGMIVFNLLASQGMTPGDCVLTGLCGLLAPERPVAPGVMYVAVGLVGIGVWGLRRARRAADGE